MNSPHVHGILQKSTLLHIFQLLQFATSLECRRVTFVTSNWDIKGHFEEPGGCAAQDMGRSTHNDHDPLEEGKSTSLPS